MKIAGIWARIGGAFIDLIIVFILWFLVMLPWYFMIGITDPLAASKINYETWEPRDLFVFLVIDYLYSVILQSGSKQGTWGQRAMGLQVIKNDGSAVTFGTASIRYFMSLVSSILFKIGYVIAIFTEKKQTLHDLAAGVVVIRRLNNSEESSGSVNFSNSTASTPNTQPSALPMANLNAKSLTSQSTEEDIWALASNEMNSRNRNEGLWAMCFASADGDVEKAKVAYLKQRVGQLVLEVNVLIENERHRVQVIRRRRNEALENQQTKKYAKRLVKKYFIERNNTFHAIDFIDSLGGKVKTDRRLFSSDRYHVIHDDVNRVMFTNEFMQYAREMAAEYLRDVG